VVFNDKLTYNPKQQVSLPVKTKIPYGNRILKISVDNDKLNRR